MTILFISDLHLSQAEPAITQQFLAFLRGAARTATHLYILGDLFEFWVGDDDPDPTYAQVQTELKALTSAGVPCSILHGNRDFLLGKAFCRRTGCQLLRDGSVITLGQQRVALLHGDTLCTDDVSYQRLRRIVRNPVVQWLFCCLSLTRRTELANRIRRGSQMHTGQTAAAIMDVNNQAVLDEFARRKVSTLIHGHTHRPAIHTHHGLTRIVLGDWYTQGSVLRWQHGQFELTTLPR